MVSKMHTHIRIISINATPNACMLKNRIDQKKLRINWRPKNRYAFSFTGTFDFQTRKNAIPIMIYNAVHTGPKIQFGGLKDGLLMFTYQPGISFAVTNPEIPPTAKQTVIESMSLR